MAIELLQQVRLLDPVTETDRVADVLIEDGIVRAIADSLADYPSEAIVQNCQNLILGPGLVDLYSHSGEPGAEDRETLTSLMQAAAAGGFTRVALLPDTTPALDTPASIAWLRNRADVLRDPHALQSASLPRLYPWAALTIGVQGQQMTELAELATTGIVGFADGKPLKNWLLVRRVLEYLRSQNQPIALWACDPDLTGNGAMREGQESIRFGLPGVPAIAETAALSALLECVEMIGTPVHLMRISTARSVELIRAAKARGVPVTASTSWIHLLLSSTAVGSYDPNLRLNPPLGNPADQAALIQGLREGTLDAIAIDHTPYTYEEKTVAFAEAPAGTIGLELALPLLWQAFVATGEWPAIQLWRALSTHPAHCLRQMPATIVPDQPAEMLLFDPSKPWRVDERSLLSLASNTPWLGQEITGRVVKTWAL